MVQETWVEKKDLDKTVERLDGKYRWYGKAALEKKHKAGRASGGQLIAVRRSLGAEWKVEEWQHGLTLRIGEKGVKEAYTIISVYNNDRRNWGKCLEKLDEEIEKFEDTTDRLIVVGDLNVRIGEEQEVAECGPQLEMKVVRRRSEDKEVRSEGRRLLRWCEEKAWVIMNGRANGDEEGKVTCLGYGQGLGSVLDLVMVKIGEDLEIPEWFKGMRVTVQEGSDHLPVIFRVEWKERTKDSSEEGQKGQERMRWKEGKSEKFMEAWREVWSERKEENGRQGDREECDKGVEDRWRGFSECIKEAARKSRLWTRSGKESKNKAVWDDGTYKRLRKENFKLLHQFRMKRTWAAKGKYRRSCRGLEKCRSRLIKEWLERKQGEVAKAKNVTEWWKAMDWYRRKRAQRGTSIKKKEWRGHFMELLEGEDVDTEMDGERGGSKEREELAMELNGPWTEEEIERAVKGLKNGKAAGEDGITAEFMKNLPLEGQKELVEIVKEVWDRERIVKSWRTARIFPIHKKGDREVVKNYRGVSLLDIGYKIVATIMAKRLSSWLEGEGKLSEGQAGFRAGRGTMEQIFVLNAIIGSRLKRKGGKLHVAFVDFEAAFDKVDREILWRKMQKMGVEGKFLNMLKEIYRWTWCEVITADGMTDGFRTTRGVRQGCPLSPILFNIYINDLEEELRRKGEGGTGMGSVEKGVKVFALMYADDLAIVAEDEDGLRSMLRTLEKWSEKNRMRVSTEKTKVMTFRNGGRRKKEKLGWKYAGKVLEEVKEFKYLGFWFTTKNQYGTHTRKVAGRMQQLINKAWGEARRAAVDSLARKLLLMDTTVKAGALYGVEIWGWQRKEIIERVQARFVKACMGLPKNTPDYLWKMEAGRREVEVEALRRAAYFLLKLARCKEDRWAYKCMREEIRGILNGIPSYWGGLMMDALKELGDGRIIGMIWRKESVDEIERRVQELLVIKEDQGIQGDWGKIEKSSYCGFFKELKKDKEMERHWLRQDIKGWQKEVWSRWRCGCATRGGKKGFTNDRCRGCNRVSETMEHVTSCDMILKGVQEESREQWRKWKGGCEEREWRQKLVSRLGEGIDRKWCAMLKEIDKVLKSSCV